MIGEISCQVSYLSFLSDIIGIKLLMGDTLKNQFFPYYVSLQAAVCEIPQTTGSSSSSSSVAQSCPNLCDPMSCSMPGLPVHHQLPEFTQIHVH